MKQWGFYVGDQWKVQPNLTLTLGGRVDMPRFSDRPLANPVTVALFGYATDVVPSPTQFSPRFGFNWDVMKDGRNQVRGGLGVFTGRTPYVWLSNNFIGTGIQFARLSISNNNANRIPFVQDPDNQPTQIGATQGAASNEYAFVDPDFKFPSLVRYNVAFDRQLGFAGLVATAEFLYANTLQDILYKNVNLLPTGETAFDGRPVFTRVDALTGAAYLLANTTKGDSWTLNLKVERLAGNGLYGSASYLYNDATSVNDGTSSTAASQFGNNPVPGDPNDPPVTPSNYATGHRLNLAASYTMMLFGGADATPLAFASIRRAITEAHLEVAYQPQILAGTRALYGVEALVRWRDPERGLMSTSEFVRLAEDAGLITAVTDYVLGAAMRQVLAWERDGLAQGLSLAVNVSGVELRSGTLVPMIERHLRDHGFAASALELEITESTAMLSGSSTAMVLGQLKSMGIRLSIDDFGTGYSSLSRLQRLPVNALKIDRSFVDGIEGHDSGALAQAIILMAHSLGLTVTGEGVETAAQLAFLEAHGCDRLQGYFVSYPLAPTEMCEYLRGRAKLDRGEAMDLP